MLVKTDRKTRTIGGYKIKLYGFVVKIIDFGFACIQFNNQKSKLRVPTGTYSDNICDQKYLDLLFLICRISSKPFTLYNVPSNIRKMFRLYIKELLKVSGLQQINGIISTKVDTNSLNKYSELEIINKKKKKIEYKIVSFISDNPVFYNEKSIKYFYPLNIYKSLVNINH